MRTRLYSVIFITTSTFCRRKIQVLSLRYIIWCGCKASLMLIEKTQLELLNSLFEASKIIQSCKRSQRSASRPSYCIKFNLVLKVTGKCLESSNIQNMLLKCAIKILMLFQLILYLNERTCS